MEQRANQSIKALIPERLQAVLCQEPVLAEAYLVGGFVRDALLGLPSKDIDVEVFGCAYADLAAALQKWGRVDLVGRSFGVIKFTLSGLETVDFSIPRRDSKTGPGHQGFSVEMDPGMTLAEAVRRRDFTINALHYDLRREVVIDCTGGARDLEARCLRMVDSERFADDPLRVLRAMQFLARFDLVADASLVARCREMQETFSELASERVCQEWLKWAAKSVKPSVGIKFLFETGWIKHFPELQAIQDVPQDSVWHPEGDVLTHTLHCCDAMVALPEFQTMEVREREVLMLATLLHDVGKAVTTQEVERDGERRIVSPGHESEGATLAGQFLKRLGVPHALLERVVPLVANHMVHLKDPSPRAIRRLALRLQPETIAHLGVLMTADSHGRPPLPKAVPQTVSQLLEKSRDLALSAASPKPILKGRDLLPLGFKPGRDLGRTLKLAFEAQLDGAFDDRDGALAWIKNLVESDELALSEAPTEARPIRAGSRPGNP